MEPGTAKPLGAADLDPGPPGAGEAIVRCGAEGPWYLFTAPRTVVATSELAAVPGALAAVQSAVDRDGLWAVVALAYEAGPAFDAAIAAHTPRPDAPPLLWAALYSPPLALRSPPAATAGAAWRLGPLTPSLDDGSFLAAFARLQAHIAAGDTYQVNLSYRVRGGFAGDPWAFFRDLAEVDHPQGPGHAAYLDLGTHVLASASPELFFRQDGTELEARPMKGTAPRGRTPDEDVAAAARLTASPKERAENVMVVDMLRNDLGRVARDGSVAVPQLCTVERYPTVLQMTSTVTATTDAAPAQVLAALFPCASITGAPKIAATCLVRALEDGPRGLYTGAVGWIAPGRRAAFAVTIRSAVLDRAAGRLEYGVGSGIVADSDAVRELAECRLKARVLTARRPAFALLETLVYDPAGSGAADEQGDADGFWLLGEHLARLTATAGHFGYRCDPARVREALDRAVRDLAETDATAPRRVRLTLAPDGTPDVTLAPAEAVARHRNDAPATPLRLVLAPSPVDVEDVFLFHKTTHRAVYADALAAASAAGADDALLYNAVGEVTEATRFNLVAELDGALVTPPVACGLLAGTFRSSLLASGTIHERVLTIDDLARGDGLWLINAVRGWRRAVLGGSGERPG